MAKTSCRDWKRGVVEVSFSKWSATRQSTRLVTMAAVLTFLVAGCGGFPSPHKRCAPAWYAASEPNPIVNSLSQGTGLA